MENARLLVSLRWHVQTFPHLLFCFSIGLVFFFSAVDSNQLIAYFLVSILLFVKLKEENSPLADKNFAIARKLGFPEIIMPGISPTVS